LFFLLVVSAALISGQLDWNSSPELYSARRGHFLFHVHVEQHSYQGTSHRAFDAAVLFLFPNHLHAHLIHFTP
jgi:hypothetical protein